MKNAYEIRGEVTAIFLKSPKFGDMETLISTNKLQKVNDYPNSWLVCKSGNKYYAYGKVHTGYKTQKTIMLHRWITNAPSGFEVDHWNHEGLDNTDSNLRVITTAQNQQNRKCLNSNNKSGIRGVHWSKRDMKWQARVKKNGKKIYLGNFNDIQEAEKVTIEYRKKHMPFSVENKVRREEAHATNTRG